MAHITIPAGEPLVSYTPGGSSTGPFNVTFPIFSTADLNVMVNGVLLSSSDWTFTPTDTRTGGYQAGYITLDSATTYEVVIYRDTTRSRTSDYASGPLDINTLNTDVDRTVARDQDLKMLLDRSLRQPMSDAAAIGRLPAKASRASAYLAFDANGDPVAITAALSGTPVSSFMATVLDDADAATARATLGVTAANLGLVIGTNVQAYDADLSELASFSTLAFTALLSGLTLSNNGSDATNDIDIATGVCYDKTRQKLGKLSSALTKQLDANWAAGTNAGMRYSGAAIANGTYHLWLVWKADGTTDVYATPSGSASTSTAALALLQAETGGSSYAYIQYIGSILRESAAIVPFQQDGDLFMRKTFVTDVNATNPGTSAVTRTLSVPVGLRVGAIFVGAVSTTTLSTLWYAYFSDLNTTDSAAGGQSQVRFASTSIAQTYVGAAQLEIMTNTSAQVRSRIGNSDASTLILMFTLGWRISRKDVA